MEAERKRASLAKLAPPKEAVAEEELEAQRKKKETALAIEYRLANERAREADKKQGMDQAQAQAARLLQEQSAAAQNLTFVDRNSKVMAASLARSLALSLSLSPLYVCPQF